MKHLPWLLCVLCIVGEAVPADDAVHEGVATCASSLCHGSAREKPDSPLLRNEYLTWQRYDAHADAYQTLRERESRVIAERLDIGPAHKAELCLDCHTDNVPPERRGRRFQLSDGVGCESCHGGAEHWLEHHTGEQATHAENVERGLVPLEKAQARANVCLDCHLGDDTRFAGHDLMGAGHPRLQFELMTYSVSQPWHYRPDADYHERKPEADNTATLWAVGQVETARRMLKGLSGERFKAGPVWPELAFFDCHACHAPMSADKWAPRATSRGLPPGSVRLNDSALVMTLLLDTVLPGGDTDSLLADIRALHKASGTGHDAVRQAAAALDEHLTGLTTRLQAHPLDSNRQRALLREIAGFSAEGRFNDYLTAEQAAMAAQVLLRRGDTGLDGRTGELNRLFDSLNNPDRLDQDAFRRAMEQLEDTL